MAQVTIYIKNELEEKMVAAAAAQQISKSRWISELIEDKLQTSWPASIEEMVGTWSDFPDQLENKGADVKREEL